MARKKAFEAKAGETAAPPAAERKSWQARIAGATDPLAAEFVESLSFDRRLAPYDIAGSIAHATMLCEVELITPAELSAIRKGLEEIRDEIARGTFVFDISQEDIHMAVEAALIARIGEPGRKLHTGRSRNDQVSLDVRLWCVDAIGAMDTAAADVQKSFVQLAAREGEIAMPSYTHLQRAQPITAGHELLAYVEMLQRDRDRLADGLKRTRVSPLGSGAAAGSTLPIDRRKTAALLNFPAITANSLDGVSDRDFLVEYAAALSLMAVHLSRWAEQWILYSSTEFGFLRLGDAYTTGSSMMPQKRNPDMLELIRGKTGGVIGQLVALLTMLKGQPLAYNRDMQEDKRWIFAAHDTVLASLRIAAGIVANTTFLPENIRRRLEEGFLDATVLAEYLVKQQVPFRTAHHVVGTLVALCDTRGLKSLAELPLETMQQECAAIGADVYGFLGAGQAVARYRSEGAGGLQSLRRQIAAWNKRLK